MNVTFLIGNGFDLNLGLNTKYTDFLQYYCHPKRKKTALIDSFANEILKDAPLWSNAEWAFGEYTDEFDGTDRTVDDFCECHEDFCIQLSKYLRAEQTSLVDHPTEAGKILKDALTALYKRLDYKDQSVQKNCELFASCVANLTKGFREQPTNDINESISKMPGGITYNFLTFNYTECLDAFVDMLRHSTALGTRVVNGTQYKNAPGNLIHVHGTTQRDMVLGLNDISQIRNAKLFEGVDEDYLNQVIKRQTNLINEQRTDQKASAILSSSDVIYVYGMSIGATDAIWWERICAALRQRGNNILIIHAFDAPDDSLIRRKYRIFERNRRNEFLKYSKLSAEEKESIAKRIYISGANIFSEFSGIVEEHDSISELLEKQEFAPVTT